MFNDGDSYFKEFLVCFLGGLALKLFEGQCLAYDFADIIDIDELHQKVL